MGKGVKAIGFVHLYFILAALQSPPRCLHWPDSTMCHLPLQTTRIQSLVKRRKCTFSRIQSMVPRSALRCQTERHGGEVDAGFCIDAHTPDAERFTQRALTWRHTVGLIQVMSGQVPFHLHFQMLSCVSVFRGFMDSVAYLWTPEFLSLLRFTCA